MSRPPNARRAHELAKLAKYGSEMALDLQRAALSANTTDEKVALSDAFVVAVDQVCRAIELGRELERERRASGEPSELRPPRRPRRPLGPPSDDPTQH